MPRYSVAGLTLASGVSLPELPETDASTPADWTFELAPAHPDEPVIASGHETRGENGEIWRVLSLEGDRLLLRFPGAATFVADAAERRLLCTRLDDAADGVLRHLLLDQVIPTVLAMEGRLVLHASAVAMPAGAVAFIGASGAGKSSLAASFLADGLALLADDFLHLKPAAGGFRATASYPGLRLWPDSRDHFSDLGSVAGSVVEGMDKRRIATTGTPLPTVPLLGIIVLSDDEPADGMPFALGRMPPREGFLVLYKHGFRLGALQPERQRDEFLMYTRLVTSTQLLRLDYRWGYDLLPEIRSAIRATLEGATRG